ncbi:MAG: hypothetical protein HY963_02235 [Ignavibacteriales bacterium]|nr:hypothetical protein [Ignavibacteriales bacterium]
MDDNKVEKLECPHCKSVIKKDNDFCPDCGTLFSDEVKCLEHKDTNAEGVCVICCEPLCSECGIFINEIFLCNEHGEYEIYEGMACIFGNSDSTHIGFAKSNLETEGLHPFIFSRKASSVHLNGAYYSLINVSGEYSGNLINELQLMVPFQEVIRAEEILRDLNLLE